MGEYSRIQSTILNVASRAASSRSPSSARRLARSSSPDSIKTRIARPKRIAKTMMGRKLPAARASNGLRNRLSRICESVPSVGMSLATLPASAILSWAIFCQPLRSAPAPGLITSANPVPSTAANSDVARYHAMTRRPMRPNRLIGQAGGSADQREEDDRHDDHLEHLDEHLPERQDIGDGPFREGRARRRVARGTGKKPERDPHQRAGGETDEDAENQRRLEVQSQNSGHGNLLSIYYLLLTIYYLSSPRATRSQDPSANSKS